MVQCANLKGWAGRPQHKSFSKMIFSPVSSTILRYERKKLLKPQNLILLPNNKERNIFRYGKFYKEQVLFLFLWALSEEDIRGRKDGKAKKKIVEYPLFELLLQHLTHDALFQIPEIRRYFEIPSAVAQEKYNAEKLRCWSQIDWNEEEI